MARILARALRPLGGLFGVEGSQISTDELDLSTVQLVSEVNDLAGYSQGPGLHSGRALYQAHLDFTVSAVISDTISAYAPTNVVGGWSIPATHDLWAVGAFVTIENTGLTVIDYFIISIDYPSDYVGAIDAGGAEVAIEHTVFAGQLTVTNNAASPPVPMLNEIPDLNRQVWIPRGSNIVFKGRTTGAGNVNATANLIVQALPKGIRPS